MDIQPLPVKLNPHFFKGKKNNNSIFKQDLYPSPQDVHFVKWNTTAIILAQQTAFSISWCKPPLLEKKSTACLSSLVLSPVIANMPLKKTKNRQTKEAPCNLYLHSGVWAERMMLVAEELPHRTLKKQPLLKAVHSVTFGIALESKNASDWLFYYSIRSHRKMH